MNANATDINKPPTKKNNFFSEENIFSEENNNESIQKQIGDLETQRLQEENQYIENRNNIDNEFKIELKKINEIHKDKIKKLVNEHNKLEKEIDDKIQELKKKIKKTLTIDNNQFTKKIDKITSDNKSFVNTFNNIYDTKSINELGNYINHLENLQNNKYEHHRDKRLAPLKNILNTKQIDLEKPDKDDKDDKTPVITKRHPRFLVPKLDTLANLPKTSLGGGKRKTLHNKRKKNKINRHRSTFSHSKRARSM